MTDTWQLKILTVILSTCFQRPNFFFTGVIINKHLCEFLKSYCLHLHPVYMCICRNFVRGCINNIKAWTFSRCGLPKRCTILYQTNLVEASQNVSVIGKRRKRHLYWILLCVLLYWTSACIVNATPVRRYVTCIIAVHLSSFTIPAKWVASGGRIYVLVLALVRLSDLIV